MNSISGFSARLTRSLLVLALCARLVGAQEAARPKFTITPDIQMALDSVSGDSLRGHLSFLASDCLRVAILRRAGSTLPRSTSRPSSGAPDWSRQATTATFRRPAGYSPSEAWMTSS